MGQGKAVMVEIKGELVATGKEEQAAMVETKEEWVAMDKEGMGVMEIKQDLAALEGKNLTTTI